MAFKRSKVFFFEKKKQKAFVLFAVATVGLGGGAWGQAAQETCVDVQVGSAQSYDCLNQQLKAATQGAQRFSSDGSAPYNAGSVGNVTGQFNEGATRNRLGPNFGKSVTPARPSVVYAPAFPPHW